MFDVVVHGFDPSGLVDSGQGFNFFAWVNVAAVKLGNVFVSDILAVLTREVRAFADGGFDDKFMTIVAAKVAVIGWDSGSIEAESGENLGISIVHVLVLGFELCVCRMEGVGIFHNKFADAQEAAAGTQFVSKFGGELVDAKRQIAVADLEFAD